MDVIYASPFSCCKNSALPEGGVTAGFNDEFIQIFVLTNTYNYCHVAELMTAFPFMVIIQAQLNVLKCFVPTNFPFSNFTWVCLNCIQYKGVWF